MRGPSASAAEGAITPPPDWSPPPLVSSTPSPPSSRPRPASERHSTCPSSLEKGCTLGDISGRIVQEGIAYAEDPAFFHPADRRGKRRSGNSHRARRRRRSR